MFNRSNKIFIIGFVGRAGAGKSTAAQLLGECVSDGEKFVTLNFAGELKNIMKQIGWNGQKDKKGRKFIQIVGEGARYYIRPTCWVDMLMSKVDGLQGPIVVAIDDVRHINECQAILERGGILIYLERGEPLTIWEKVGRYYKYPSEREMRAASELCSYSFYNEPILALKPALRRILERLKGTRF